MPRDAIRVVCYDHSDDDGSDGRGGLLVMSCPVSFPSNMQMPVFWLKLLSWHKAVKITGGDSNLYFWAALVCWVCNPCWALSIPQEQHGRAEGGQGMGASQHWPPSIAPPLPVQLPFSFVLLLSYLFLEFESMLRVCHALLRHSNRHVCFVQKETA